MKMYMMKVQFRWPIIVAAGVLVSGCKKGAAAASVPTQLQTEWYGGQEPSTLVITATGIATQDLICSGNYKLTSMTSAGPGSWKYSASDGDDKFTGTIKLASDGKTLEASSDRSDCYNNGLSGKFKRKDSIVFPEKVRGTWYSCNVPSCAKVKVLITAKSINVTGTGGGETCISDTATIKDINIDGPLTKVTHSGLDSSGSDLSIVQASDGIDISGADTLSGRYTSTECTAAARAGNAKRAGSEHAAGGGGGDCKSKCMATQNACVMRCAGKSEHATQVCVSECAAKGQECMGGC